MPKCEPVQCDILDYTGQTKTVDSYGRRKKRSQDQSLSANNLMALLTHRHRRNTEPEEVMVVQTLRIVDRYGKRKEQPKALVSVFGIKKIAMISTPCLWRAVRTTLSSLSLGLSSLAR